MDTPFLNYLRHLYGTVKICDGFVQNVIRTHLDGVQERAQVAVQYNSERFQFYGVERVWKTPPVFLQEATKVAYSCTLSLFVRNLN